MKNRIIKLRNNKLLTATVIIFTGQMVANALNYFYNLGQGKILSMDKFPEGAYSNFWALNSFSYYFFVPVTAITLISTQMISKWYANGEHGKIAYFIRKSLKYLILISLISSLFAIPFSLIFNSFLHIDSNIATLTLNLSITLSLLYPVMLGAFAGLQKFFKQTLSYAIATAIKFVLGLSLALFIGLEGAIFGNLILTISFIVICYLFLRNYLKQNFDSAKDYKINFPWKLFASSILSTFAISAFLSNDVILAKHYLSQTPMTGHDIDQASIYAAISLFGRIIYFFSITFASIVLPFASFAKAKGRDSINVLQKTIAISFISLVPIILIYFAFAEPIIKITFSDKYLPAADYLGVYAISVGIYALESILINYFIAIEKKSFAFIPSFFAILQIGLILFFHDDIDQFIAIQFMTNMLCLCSLGLYLIIIRAQNKTKQ